MPSVPPAPKEAGQGPPLPGTAATPQPRRAPAPHEDLGDAEADSRAAAGDERHLAPGGTKGQSELSAGHSPRSRRPRPAHRPRAADAVPPRP